MKSPTKQDFIDENQQGIEIQRKIRVKILDPDATESSSDDEQEKRPKVIVHEIIQEKVNIQSFSQKDKDPFDFYQFSGKLPPIIRKRLCGKFAAEVVDVQTSDSSKVMTLSDQFSGKLQNVIVEKVISAKSEIGCSSSDPPLMVDSQTSDLSKVKTGFDQFYGKLPPMVRRRKSGKFGCEIKHPISKKRIWLGTFNTPEEASEVYQSKKLEFEKLKKPKNVIVEKVISAKSELGSSSSNPPLMVDSQSSDSSRVKIQSFSLNQFSGKLPPMVRRTKTGKFSSRIKHPISKKRIWLGTFSTPEEASEVYQSKKLEFEKLEKPKNANVKEVISAKIELGSSSSEPPLMVDSQSLDSSKVKIQSFSLNQSSGKLPPMVRKRKSGKFVTEIKHPVSKKRIWLGSYDTAEEASEVYQSKKLEFEKYKKVKNANVKKDISAKSELGPFSSDPPLVVHSQTTDSSNVLDDQLRKAINANMEVVISVKSELGYSSSCDLPIIVDSQISDSPNEFDERLKMAINAKEISAKSELLSSSSSGDPPLIVDSQTSESSNGQESEEEMWMGQWIRISGDKEVKFSQKLGVPVVDNYGFLLGEFSELDDLSISI